MSYSGYDQTGGGYIPPPDDNTNPNSDAGGFFGPPDATPAQDYRPEKAFWDDQGSSEPASKASFWDDQGSSTPAPSDQPGFTPEAGTKKRTDFWDNAVAPADTPAPTSTRPYQGATTVDQPAFGLGDDAGGPVASPATYWDDKGATAPTPPAPGAPFGTQPATDAERQRTADVPGGDLTTGFGPYQTTETERNATQAFVNYNIVNGDLQQASDSFTAKYGPDQFSQLFPSLHGEADKLGQDMQSYVDYVNAGGYYDEGVWQGLLDKKANLDQRWADAQQQAAQRYGPDGQPIGQYADDLNALLALDARQKAAGAAVDQAGNQITQAQLATLANNQGYADATSRTLDDLARRYRQAQQDEASIAFAQNAWDARNANDVLYPYQGPRAPDQSVLDAPAPAPAPPGAGGIRGALGHIGGALGHVAGGVVGGLERVAGLNPIVPPTDPRYVGAGMTTDPLGSAISGSSLAMAPFQYPLDVVNRAVSLGTYGLNRTGQQYGAGEWGNALKSTAMDFLQYPQHIPYIFTGQGWGMAPQDYQQLQFQAGHPLDPLLPASWGDLPGTQQGGYNTFALGGLTRAGDFLSALGRGGAPHAPLGAGGGIDLSAWDPRNWHGSSIDARALQNDIQSGVPLEELEKRYRGNIAAQVVWDLANPGNFVGPGELLKPAIQGIHALGYGRLEGPAAEAIGRWARSAHTAEALWKAGDEPVLTSTLGHITGGRSPEEVGQLLNDQRSGLRLPTGLNDPQTVDAINTLQRGIDRVAAARGIDRDAATQALFSRGTWDNVLRQWAADSGLQGVDAVEAYVLRYRDVAMDNMIGNIIKNEKRLQFGGQGIQNLAAVQHASEMAIATRERAIRIENAVRESQGLAPRGAITDTERAAIIQRFSERPPALASARDRAAFLGDTALGSARAGWLALSPKYELANYAGNWFNALYEGALTPTADLPFVGKAASEIGRFAPIEYPLNFAQKYGIEPNIGQSLNDAVLNAGRKAETLAKPGELVPPTLDPAVKKNAFQQAGGYFSDTMTQAGARMGRFGQAINVPRALMGSLVKLALPLAENQSRFALHHVDFHQELTRRAAEIVANAYARWGTNPNAREFLDQLVAYISEGHVHPDEIGTFIAEQGGFRGVPRPFDPIVPDSGMARGRPSGGPRAPRGPEPPVLTQLDPTKPESTLERFASNMGHWERTAATGGQDVLDGEIGAGARAAADKLNIDLPPKATNSDLLAALREKLPGRDLNAATIRNTFGSAGAAPLDIAAEAPTRLPTNANPLAREVNTGKWFHGSSTPDISLSAFDQTRMNPNTAFGPGLYLTDNPADAVGIATSGYNAGSGPTLYSARANVRNVLDLGAPVTAESRELFLRAATANGASPEDVAFLRNADFFRNNAELWRGTSQYADGPASLNDALARNGVDALLVRAGADRHVVVLDPNDRLGLGTPPPVTQWRGVPQMADQGAWIDAARGGAPPTPVNLGSENAGTNTPLRQRFADDGAAAAERLRQKFTTLHAVAQLPNLDDFNDLIMVGASVLVRGITTVGDWAAEMTRLLRERDPGAARIFERFDTENTYAHAQRYLYDQIAQQPGFVGLDAYGRTIGTPPAPTIARPVPHPNDPRDVAALSTAPLWAGHASYQDWLPQAREFLRDLYGYDLMAQHDPREIYRLARENLANLTKATQAVDKFGKPTGLGRVTDYGENVALYNAGRHGANWYYDTGPVLRYIFGDHMPDVTRWLAPTAENATPVDNATRAMILWSKAHEGTLGAFAGGPGTNVLADGLARWKAGVAAETPLYTGPKINNYGTDIAGDSKSITMDRHEARGWGIPGNPANWNEYLTLDAFNRYLARGLGIEPSQLQAGRWSAVRDRAIDSGVLKEKDPLNMLPLGSVLHGLAQRGSLEFMRNSPVALVSDMFQRMLNFDPATVAQHFSGAYAPIEPFQLTSGAYYGRLTDINKSNYKPKQEAALPARLHAEGRQTPRPQDLSAALARTGTPADSALGVYEPRASMVQSRGAEQAGQGIGNSPSLGRADTTPPVTRPTPYQSIDDRLRAVGLTPPAGVAVPDPTLSQRLLSNEGAALRRIADRNAPLGVTYRFDPKIVAQDVRDYAQWGALRIARAAVDFAAWSKEMIGRFTDPDIRTSQQIDHFNTNVRPNLQAIYDEASRAVKENDISSRTRPQRLNDAALAAPAQHLQDIVDDPSSYRNVLDTLAARRGTMSNTAFIKELKAYGSATGVHMGAAPAELAGTFQRFREGLAELRVQVDPSYKSAEAVKARARLAASAGASGAAPNVDRMRALDAEIRAQELAAGQQFAAQGYNPLDGVSAHDQAMAGWQASEPAYRLTPAGGPQPRQITRRLGDIPADERAARVRDAALERQYRVSEFNRLFAPESGPIPDFGPPGTIGEATTGATREEAATARMYRGPQGMREGPAYRGALPGPANDLPWDLKYLGAGPEPPLQLPARTLDRGLRESALNASRQTPVQGLMPDTTAAFTLPGDRGGTMRPPGPLLGPDYPTYHAGAQIGGPGAPGFTMGQGAMGSPRLGPAADLLAGASSPFVREAWKQTPEWQAMVSEMLSTLPNQWRQAIAHANADAFMNSVRVFNNYGLQLKGVSNLLGGLSPFFQYQIKTPLYWASVAARNPGIVGGIARATDDVRQYNADSGLRRNSTLNKVWLGDKWGVDLRDLIPLTRMYDALFNRSSISDTGAVMRQDPASQLVRNYLESGVSPGMWPWTSAALSAAGITHPPLENMTEPPSRNWLGNAAEKIGLPRQVGTFIGSVLNPGDIGEQAFRAGLEKLAPIQGQLPPETQQWLQSAFPNGLKENSGVSEFYAGWFLRQMVDQGVTDEDSATHAATYHDGPVWTEALNRTRQWSQDGYNASMGYPGRVGQLLPGEAEGKKPVYPDTNPAPFRYARGAGEGGRDAGIRQPVLDAEGNQVVSSNGPQFYPPQPSQPGWSLNVLYDRSIPDYDPVKQAAARYLKENNVGVADQLMNGEPSEQRTAQAQFHRQNAINYPLEHNVPTSFPYNRRAGEGGTDLGTGEISNAGNYYIQSPEDEQYATAKAQLNPALLTFGSARTSDYARDYLKGFGTQDVTNQGQPSEQRTTAANQRFQAQQVESDINTGRYLDPSLRPGLIDYRMAQDAYEGVPMKDPGTGQTVLVKDFLNTAGYYNLLDQAAQQRDQGDTAGLAKTQGQLNWISSVPQVADYLAATRTAGARDQMPLVNLRRDDALLNPDTQAALAPLRKGFEFVGDNGERIQTSGKSFDARDQGAFGVRRDRILYDQLTDAERSAYQAWDDWQHSPDGVRYSELEKQQRAIGAFGSPEEKAWFKAHQDEMVPATNARNAAIKAIAAQTGENPVSVANKVGGGLYPDFKPSTVSPKDLTVYPTGGGSGGYSGGGGRSSSSRGTSATSLAIEARKTFFDAFDTLSKNEKAAAYDLKSLDSALAKGSRLSASEWGKALETLRAEVPNIRDRQAASDSFYSFYDRLSSSEKSAIRDLMSFDRKTATADDWRRTLQRAQDRLSGAQEYDSNTTRGAVRTTRGGAYSAFYDQRSTSSPVALPVDLVERFGWAGAKKVMAQRQGGRGVAAR